MPKKNYDYLIDKRFCKLVVREILYLPNHAKARCICDCGNEITTYIFLLNNGETKACGCLHKKMEKEVKPPRRKHGEHGTRLYWIWRDIIKRCYNPNCKCYKWYGGKGVIVCDEWKTEYSNFRDWALANGYADELTIDRINPEKNYEPSNCQWITQSENTSKMQRQKKEYAELKKKYTESEKDNG
jgi:hypothetical protein